MKLYFTNVSGLNISLFILLQDIKEEDHVEYAPLANKDDQSSVFF